MWVVSQFRILMHANHKQVFALACITLGVSGRCDGWRLFTVLGWSRLHFFGNERTAAHALYVVRKECFLLLSYITQAVLKFMLDLIKFFFC